MIASTTATMTVSERFRAVTSGQPVDRLPRVEWASWWNKTLERWRGEGLPLTERYGLYDHFGLDRYYQDWLTLTRPGIPKPAHHGAPLIETMDDYERIKPFLFPEYALNPHWPEWAREQKAGRAAIWFTFSGFFWFPRTLLGIEPHLYAFFDEPELMHRINEDLATWALQQLEHICAITTPDFMTFGEDMSYNNGPMVSEALFDGFMLPYYRRVVPALKERGIRVLIDSDGDVTTCAPWFERAGIEGILPLERQAGVDIDVLQANHPGMVFVGHFDKMTMPRGRDAMRAEFERLLPAMRRGRFIPSVDHQTPPGVSLEQYGDYLDLLREYTQKAAR